jgi:hypothetical protein
MQASNFYIYEHIRPDTGMVFYVGKGCGKRLNCGKAGGGKRNKHWKNVVSKAGGFDARKLVDNIDEELAFLVEEERIDQLKRLGIDLTNKTLGGCGGIKGYSHTEETKKKIIETRAKTYKKENHHRFGKFGKDNPMYGFKQSAEARKGMSDNCCMKRPEVVAKISGENATLAKTVEYNGQVFKTINDLAKHLGVKRSTVGVWIHRNPEKYGIKVLGKTKDLKSV